MISASIQQASVSKEPKFLRDPSSVCTSLLPAYIDDATKKMAPSRLGRWIAKEHIDQIGQGQPRKLRECLNRDDRQDPQGA